MVATIVDFSTVSANPLNPVGAKLRWAVWNALEAAEKDDRITSLILTGGKSGNFSSGADITEFAKVVDTEQSDLALVHIIKRIENFPKPIIAAVDGVAFGGGCELTLCSHYRVATKTASLSLPEVHVGVIPGGGGTQRLPRLIGVAKALDMIITGKPVNAVTAQKLGLIDQVAKPGETLMQCAQRWADWAELMPLDDRRVGHRQIKESKAELASIFAAVERKLPSEQMGGAGVRAALSAVKACILPIEEGNAIESKHFIDSLLHPQGVARRHAFFAVRRAQKPLGKAPKDHPFLSKSYGSYTVGVAGAGLMGSGIAMVLLQAGFKVILVDVYKQSLDKGMAFLTKTIKTHAQRGKLSPKKASAMMASLTGSEKLESLAPCLLVVEAVIESMKIKKKIFTSLDKITPPNAILLSNTSTLDIDEMTSVLSMDRRSRFAGWHFFSPAHIMKLVEIVRGKATSIETVAVLQHLTKRIKKTGVVVGNCDGFVGNRLLIPYGAETTFLLEQGVASVASVDKVFLRFGMALGPFQMSDLAGLDIGYNIRKERGWTKVGNTPAKNRPERYPELADVIVADLRRLGQKSGKGWYTYDPRIGKGRMPLPSSEVDALVARFAKPNQAPFKPEQMIEQVMCPLVNLGFLCLEEGIAERPSDIDVVYLYGYGWPVYRGGPMFWAENDVGLENILASLKKLSAMYPTTDYFVPSKLLQHCVERGVAVEEGCKQLRKGGLDNPFSKL